MLLAQVLAILISPVQAGVAHVESFEVTRVDCEKSEVILTTRWAAKTVLMTVPTSSEGQQFCNQLETVTGDYIRAIFNEPIGVDRPVIKGFIKGQKIFLIDGADYHE